MRFALLGNHPDGLAMAQALVATGRHALIVVHDVPVPPFAQQAKSHPDLEEVLADPEIELVIVAGPMSVRAEQLRRSVQSERDVLCVHPCADRPDIAYEAALIQGDTKRLLIPLLPGALHPSTSPLSERLKNDASPFRVLSFRQETPTVGEPPWDLLRRVGGEIVEISGLAEVEEIDPVKPLVWSGRFEKGGLFHGVACPGPAEHLSLTVINKGRETPGEEFSNRNPDQGWALLAAAIETARENSAPMPISWQDEIRALELQDALRRSVEKRRTSGLEYQEISEEIGNKGTLTLIGCGMIWLLLLVVGLSIWWPPIRWAIVPLLLGYLALLAMNWLARK